MRKIFAMLMLLASISCAGHTPMPFHYIQTFGYSAIPLKVIPVWVDEQFGAADKVAIDNAISQWNYALNGYVRIQVISMHFDMEVDVLRRVMAGDGWVILKIRSDNIMVDDGPLRDGKPAYHTLAWVNDIGGNRMYVVRDRLYNDWMTGVALHEMGHLLGASHDDAYLMGPRFNWEDYRCIDYAALYRVAEYQHLPMGRLNYCQYGNSSSD